MRKTGSYGRLIVFLIALAAGAAPAAAQTTQELLEQLKALQAEIERRQVEAKEELERRRAELEQELAAIRTELGQATAAAEAGAAAGAGAAAPVDRTEFEIELGVLRAEVEALREELKQAPGGGGSDRFTVGAQVRTRYEWNDKDFAFGRADLQHLLRSRLHLKGRASDQTSVFIQLQDSRQWGEETSTLADGSGDNIDFHQAYIKIDDLFDAPWALTLGRQELIYGGQRLIGAVGWHNIGRSFDAMKLRYGSESWVDFFNAKLAEKGQKDRNLYGIYGHIQADGHAWEPYLLTEHDKNSVPDKTLRYTLGGRGVGKFKSAAGHGFGFELEAAVQAGTLGAQDVMAFMVTGSTAYTSNHWRQHKIGIGVDYLSGDDDKADADYKAFDTLFATNHKFYGTMDFFLNVPVDTGQGGLLDLMLKTGMKLGSKTKLDLHFHNFSLAQGDDKGLGQEIDLKVDHKYRGAALQGGLGLFLPGDAMKAKKGGDEPAFKAYIQTIAAF